MNIIAVPYNRRSFYLRPDTTLNRDCLDFYLPENITSLSAVPFAYVKVCKAGKSLLRKFAYRYYGGLGYGLALEATPLIVPGEPASFVEANSLDYSTYLLTEDSEGDGVTPPDFIKEGESLFTLTPPAREEIEQTIERVTSIISIRYGDLLLFDLHKGVELLCGQRIGLGNNTILIK